MMQLEGTLVLKASTWGCSASVTQGACWDSLQVSAFKNNDSGALGQTGSAAHCQEVSSRDS